MNFATKSGRRLVAHYGTTPEIKAPAYCLIEVRPGEAPDGSCAYSVVAACPDFEAMLAAARLLS